jgi:hypothetical protein
MPADSDTAFSVFKITEKYLAGELSKNAPYWAAFQEHVLDKRGESNRLAERQYAYRKRESATSRDYAIGSLPSSILRDAKIFEQEFNKALLSDNSDAFFTRLARAAKKVDTETIWTPTHWGLVVLVCIYLHIERHLSFPLDQEKVRAIVNGRLRSQKKNTVDSGNWARCIHDPLIRELVR